MVFAYDAALYDESIVVKGFLREEVTWQLGLADLSFELENITMDASWGFKGTGVNGSVPPSRSNSNPNPNPNSDSNPNPNSNSNPNPNPSLPPSRNIVVDSQAKLGLLEMDLKVESPSSDQCTKFTGVGPSLNPKPYFDPKPDFDPNPNFNSNPNPTGSIGKITLGEILTAMGQENVLNKVPLVSSELQSDIKGSE